MIILLFSAISCTGETPTAETEKELLGLLVTPEQLILAVGQQAQLTATGLYSNHESVNLTESVDWRVEYYDTISVSEGLDTEGVLVANAEGDSQIYAQYNDIRSPFVDVIVTSATIENLEISPNDLTLTEGDQVQLQAIGTFSNGDSGNLTQQTQWITGDASVIRFDTRGFLTAVGVGITTIAARYEELESESVDVTVHQFVENGKPDLIVDAISYTPSGEINVTLFNQGSVGSTGFWVSIFVGSEPSFSEIGDDFTWIEYLGPNHGISKTFDLNIQGETTLWVLVDSSQIINESHENNNKASQVVSPQ